MTSLDTARAAAPRPAPKAMTWADPALIEAGRLSTRLGDPQASVQFFARAEKVAPGDPRVLEAAEISGKSDYIVKVIVADMAEWRDLTAAWTSGPWQIERVSSSVAMHRTKGFSGYPL